MLIYRETNWKNERGFELSKYDLTINRADASKTRKEQQAKIEKISLIAFLNKEQKRIFVNVCKRLKRNDRDFYQNKNLHATLFGFGPMSKKNYQTVRREIQLFTRSHKVALKIKLDSIRPGSMYCGNITLKPIMGVSNGTVIAIGNVSHNIEFSKYANSLTKHLMNDKNIQSILGKNFRRKFPTVWITLGYYNKKDKFRIDTALEDIFKQYIKLDKDFSFPISEISLVQSKYKNLRYPKLIQKYRI
ncbi:hypothetical protein BH18THE1_BH18THE1_17660 [soil metagenome]